MYFIWYYRQGTKFKKFYLLSEKFFSSFCHWLIGISLIRTTSVFIVHNPLFSWRHFTIGTQIRSLLQIGINLLLKQGLISWFRQRYDNIGHHKDIVPAKKQNKTNNEPFSRNHSFRFLRVTRYITPRADDKPLPEPFY